MRILQRQRLLRGSHDGPGGSRQVQEQRGHAGQQNPAGKIPLSGRRNRPPQGGRRGGQRRDRSHLQHRHPLDPESHRESDSLESHRTIHGHLRVRGVEGWIGGGRGRPPNRLLGLDQHRRRRRRRRRSTRNLRKSRQSDRRRGFSGPAQTGQRQRRRRRNGAALPTPAAGKGLRTAPLSFLHRRHHPLRSKRRGVRRAGVAHPGHRPAGPLRDGRSERRQRRQRRRPKIHVLAARLRGAGGIGPPAAPPSDHGPGFRLERRQRHRDDPPEGRRRGKLFGRQRRPHCSKSRRQTPRGPGTRRDRNSDRQRIVREIRAVRRHFQSGKTPGRSLDRTRRRRASLLTKGTVPCRALLYCTVPYRALLYRSS
mmetsp:Transcript_1822/g.3978  ORF Transcript_1822/g.3978 Transcript_1822/m.3978 type:complete len:367 (+) Transcript_1822:417-1517(+)